MYIWVKLIIILGGKVRLDLFHLRVKNDEALKKHPREVILVHVSSSTPKLIKEEVLIYKTFWAVNIDASNFAKAAFRGWKQGSKTDLKKKSC